MDKGRQTGDVSLRQRPQDGGEAGDLRWTQEGGCPPRACVATAQMQAGSLPARGAAAASLGVTAPPAPPSPNCPPPGRLP